MGRGEYAQAEEEFLGKSPLKKLLKGHPGNQEN